MVLKTKKELEQPGERGVWLLQAKLEPDQFFELLDEETSHEEAGQLALEELRRLVDNEVLI